MSAYDKHMLADDPRVLEGEKFTKCLEKQIDDIERGAVNDWIYELDQEDAQIAIMQIVGILNRKLPFPKDSNESFYQRQEALSDIRSVLDVLVTKAAGLYADRHYNDPEDQFELDDDC